MEDARLVHVRESKWRLVHARESKWWLVRIVDFNELHRAQHTHYSACVNTLFRMREERYHALYMNVRIILCLRMGVIVFFLKEIPATWSANLGALGS